MRRREFITLVGVAAVMGPSTARAQQAAKLPTIGFSGPALWAPAFEQRLRELGCVAARTVAIEYRSAEGHNERYREIATEFVRLKVNVIVTVGGSPTLAAKRATSLIPIVFVSGDPVGSGLVASLARPDSNATGIMGHPIGLAGKRLDLLRDVLPSFRRLSVMVNANIPGFQRGMMRYRRRPPRSALRRPYWKSGAPRISRRPSRPSRTVRTHCMSLAHHSRSQLQPWRWARGFQRFLISESSSTRAG